MKHFKKAISLALTVAMFLSLTACGSSGSTSGSATASGSSATSGKDSLIMGYTKEPDSVAPGVDAKTNAQMVVAIVHDGLVGKDPSDQSVIVPSISDTWSFNEDGTVLTMHIRDDIKFHDGTALTMDDVIYSLDYACKQPVNVAGAELIKEYKDAGDNNLEITLQYAYNPFLQILATPGFSIICKATHEKALADGANFGMSENGTGAYKIVSWTTGDKMVLEANDNWHRGAPEIKHVEIKLLSDETSGALMVENGEIDFFIGMNSADRSRLEANEKLTLVNAPSAGTYCLLMNQNPGSVFADNKALREAVAYAINREEILVGGMNGVGEVTPGIITPGYFGFVEDPEFYEYDPEKAKEKLAEAGYPDGIDITYKVPSDSWYANPSQVIVEQLRQVGIRCNLQIMERAPFLQEVHEQMNYDMAYYMSWGDFPDADQQVWPKYHSTSIGAQMGNHIGLNNPEVDELLENARTSQDNAEREALYAELNHMNYENVWYLWILTTYNSVVINKDLQNVVEIPSGYYNPAFYSWAA